MGARRGGRTDFSPAELNMASLLYPRDLDDGNCWGWACASAARLSSSHCTASSMESWWSPSTLHTVMSPGVHAGQVSVHARGPHQDRESQPGDQQVDVDDVRALLEDGRRILGRRANIRRAHSFAARKIQEAGEQVDEMHDGFSQVIEQIEQALSGI